MPIRINSITEMDTPAVFAAMLQEEMDACNAVFVDHTGKYIHTTADIIDQLSGDKIGKIVYTILIREDALEMLDVDLTWNNDIPTSIHLLGMREGSSDSIEYYDAETCETEQHFQLETVGRHTISAEKISGETLDAYISAFPFGLEVFSDITAFNRRMGIDHEIHVADTGLVVGGLSETFLAPGNLANGDDDNCHSFVVGIVREFKDVQVKFGEHTFDIVLAQVETAFGIIPVGMGRDFFNLAEMKAGSIIGMNAYIKADLSKPGDYKTNP